MSNQRKPVLLSMSVLEILMLMGERNAGGMSVLSQIYSKDHFHGMFIILGLDDMNIRGSQIWEGYQHHCKGDIDKFIEAIRNRDTEMVDTVNKGCKSEGYIAVTGGASDGRK